MFKWVLHLVLIATAFPVYAQESNVAPLVARLPQARDTNRVNVLTTLCQRLWHHQLAKAANYNREALVLANKLGYKKGRPKRTAAQVLFCSLIRTIGVTPISIYNTR